jgi:cytochrome c oxidase assembly factor CtaG
VNALLPKRADPVFGALVGALVLVAFLAPPLLILALIVWLVVRAERKSSQRPRPEQKRRRTRA